ncbi:RbsD/FucU family protein [Luethyella okanaganae]|uniref:RbsD/FucU family protein n=1 Tax=Luethyella okanaganae TaxID=69372 RepID=A0ABW1VGR9_9MICO
MLSGIHPILTGELLAHLDRMGHGDSLVIADANFPAYRLGRIVVEVSGMTAPAVLEAIRTVLPLDEYGGPAFGLMSSAGDDVAGVPAGVLLPVQQELLAFADAPDDRTEAIERFAFYEAAASAVLIVRTGESRAYGNAILRKGVVGAYRGPGAERG